MTHKTFLAAIMLCTTLTAGAQITERPRPAEWDNLVPGARFIDRFLPMQGERLERGAWGAEDVRQRLVDNGIEDPLWSYWGGNIVRGDDGRYHMFVCGWRENSPKGHMQWSKSFVFHTVSDNTYGPFAVVDSIGPGHNPEVYRMNDGCYVLYVIGGRYVAPTINGPWEYGKYDFDDRGMRISDGLSNLSFARDLDGTFIMVSRGGEIWRSKDGLTDPWHMVSERVYPKVKGEYEDPVLWRDSVQYHLIVNDWLGRIAYYLRSCDGINWVIDPGEAYTPGIARHKDGTSEEWFKYERLKIFQDKYGRAVQANFAVIDTLKHEDKPLDTHSSKNIAIPLNPGLLLALESENSETVTVRIRAEEGFNPQKDIDIKSLRFGASEEVNFGRGAKVQKTRKDGRDLIVTFHAADCHITPNEFAPKMIGRSKNGAMLFGFAKREPLTTAVNPFGNALVPDMIADASIEKIGDTFYCYATTDGYGRHLDTSGPPVVWKSKDFVNWSFEGTYFPSAVKEKYWAPSKAVQKNGRWYIYPTVNGYMYPAVADSPDGPFRLARGEDRFELPFTKGGTLLQTEDPGGIDADVFIDDDGQAYIFWGRFFAGKLADDMMTVTDVVQFDTPHHVYSEGPGFFKRNGIYYYYYTLGGDERYQYAYMMSRISPLGPWEAPEQDIITTTNVETGVFGPGHGSIFNDGDDYYFAFLEFGRRSTNRQTYVSKMEFNPDGTIKPLQVDLKGVGALARVPFPAALSPVSVSASSTRPPLKIAHNQDPRCQRTECFVPQFAIDHSNGSRWMPAEESNPWLQIDLGEVRTVQRSDIYFVRPTAGHTYTLLGSTDGENWTKIGGQDEPKMHSPCISIIKQKLRYLRVIIHSGEAGVWEWNVY